MALAIHEFETTLGDELTTDDLLNATFKVVETFVDLDQFDRVVFTHRIELHMPDDLIVAEVDLG